jgi:hypothetical protein
MGSENTNNNEAMKMDHEDATRLQACSRYLMGDLSATEAAAFEEHYFTCPECAEELKAGTVFAEDVRAVFHEQAQRLIVSSPAVLPQTGPGWFEKIRAGFAVPLAIVALVLLAVVIYQNAVSISGLRSEVAELNTAQSVPWVPLKLAQGSGGVTLPTNRSFWTAYFNLPSNTEFPAYCDIESKQGTRRVTLSAPNPGQPCNLLLRTADFPRGVYRFKVRAPKTDAVIAIYTLDVNPE